MLHNLTVIDLLSQMPNSVRVVLGYGLVLMAGLALTLSLVVEQAVEAPISPLGLLWMLLLAYIVFTLTLILQRKQAGWMLSIGMATLSVPLIPILYWWAGLLAAAAGVLLTAALFLALRRRSARAWFIEP